MNNFSESIHSRWIRLHLGLGVQYYSCSLNYVNEWWRNEHSSVVTHINRPYNSECVCSFVRMVSALLIRSLYASWQVRQNFIRDAKGDFHSADSDLPAVQWCAVWGLVDAFDLFVREGKGFSAEGCKLLHSSNPHSLPLFFFSSSSLMLNLSIDSSHCRIRLTS
jgi:hypothetical protein